MRSLSRGVSSTVCRANRGFTKIDRRLVAGWSMSIHHLVLMGVATSGVVLSTLCDAADRDYSLTVLSDACGDPDPEVHRILTERVFTKRACVMTVAEWSASQG